MNKKAKEEIDNTRYKPEENVNTYDFAGILNNIEAGKGTGGFGRAFNGTSSGMQAGIGAVAGAVGQLGNSIISNGRSTAVGSAISDIGGKIGSALPGPWGPIVSVGSGIIGGAVNNLFGSSINEENKRAVEENINALRNFKADEGDFDSALSNANNINVMGFGQDFIGSDGAFSNKAKSIFQDLKAFQDYNAKMAYRSVQNNMENLKENQAGNLLANAHAFGGDLMTNGATWNLGYTSVDNGGTHESNPNEGIQVGIDPQGIPNLVEEGEVIYNDYVFSNRLNVPKPFRDKYKLGKKKLSYADAFKKMSKESDERPNDVISKRGLDAMSSRLRDSQEEERFKKLSPEEKAMMLAQQQQESYANGGILLNIPYSGQEQEEALFNDPFFGSPSYKGNEAQGLVGRYAEGGNLANKFLDGSYMNNNIDLFKPVPIMESLTSLDGKKPTFNTNTGYYFNDDPNNQQLFKKLLEKQQNDTASGTWLRFAPVVGSAIGLTQGLLSKPDYTNAELIENYADNVGQYDRVKANPIGDYMTYRPLDRQYAINLLNAQSGSTRRNVMNTSGGNRGQAMAGLLAADYNAGNQLGNLFRQAEEYNSNQKEKVATFNRGTNQFNAQQQMQADLANQQARMNASKISANLRATAAGMRQAIDDKRAAGIAANFSNIFDSLGAIGKERAAAKMATSTSGYYVNPTTGKLYYQGKEIKAFGGPLAKNNRRNKRG